MCVDVIIKYQRSHLAQSMSLYIQIILYGKRWLYQTHNLPGDIYPEHVVCLDNIILHVISIPCGEFAPNIAKH